MRMKNAIILCCATALAAQAVASAPSPMRATPIPGAGKWTLIAKFPDGNKGFCNARLPGDQLDTMLAVEGGRIILSGGHSDWGIGTGNTVFDLSVDGAPPVTLRAAMLNKLVIATVSDTALAQKLRHARTLEWIFPKGRVRIDVTGIDRALGAIGKCKTAAR